MGFHEGKKEGRREGRQKGGRTTRRKKEGEQTNIAHGFCCSPYLTLLCYVERVIKCEENV